MWQVALDEVSDTVGTKEVTILYRPPMYLVHTSCLIEPTCYE